VIDDHPQYRELLENLKPGWHASGLLLVTKPGELDEEMSAWLMGRGAAPLDGTHRVRRPLRASVHRTTTSAMRLCPSSVQRVDWRVQQAILIQT